MIKYFLIAFIAFFCESIDSSLGMGYGTILTPVLLLMGYKPLEIVPLILFSEFITGIIAATLHHKKGNVNLEFGGKEFKIAFLLTISSIFGTITATYLAFSLSENIIKVYIAILLIIIGISSIITLKKKIKFSWNKILALGLLASFNKGISGGGYGPVVTGGQMLSGIDSKSAIGITSLSEGFTCLIGILSFIYLNGLNFNFSLGIALLCGSVLSIPISVRIISIIKEKTLRTCLSITIIILGLVSVFTIINPLPIITQYASILLLLLLVFLSIILTKLWNKKDRDQVIESSEILSEIRKAE